MWKVLVVLSVIVIVLETVQSGDSEFGDDPHSDEDDGNSEEERGEDEEEEENDDGPPYPPNPPPTSSNAFTMETTNSTESSTTRKSTQNPNNANSVRTTNTTKVTTEQTTETTLFSTCPEDLQFWNNQVLLTWPETSKGEEAVSHPLCISESLTITTRLCDEEGWKEAPACQTLQTTSLDPCPDDLHATDDGLYCYTILDSTTFPPACPYPGVVSWEEYSTLDILPDKPVWIPATRTNTTEYGLDIFRFMEPTQKYKTPFDASKTLFYNATFLDKPCLIHHNSSHVEAVSCDLEYGAVCVYPTLHRQNDSLCSQLHATYCKQGNYNPTDLCYCQSDSTAIGNQVLAEFLEPYQNLLFQNVSCRFGLSNTFGTNPFVWTVSGTPLNYTYWAPDVDFRYSTGLLTDQGWRLVNDSFDCSIYHLTDLSLSQEVWLDFDTTNDSWFSLEVMQYSQFLYNEGQPLVFCFTDSDSSSVLYRLSDFALVIQSNSSYKIAFSKLDSGPGNYWCEAFSYPNFTVVRSTNQITTYSGEYVVLFTLPHYEYQLGNYPLTTENLLTLQNLLLSELPENCTFHPRLWKIQEIDEKHKSMNITFHLTSSQADNTEEEFEVLKSITQSQSLFDFIDFRSVHYCPTSTTLQGGVRVVWRRGNLGETLHPSNGYCVTPSGDLVQRSCIGNFIDGAYWSVVTPDCTFYPSSSLTDLLVNLSNLDQLKVISQSYKQYNTLDFLLTVKLISQVSDVGDLVEIVSNLAGIPQTTLKSAQLNFKSTDLLIKTVEQILDQTGEGEWNEPNFSVKIVTLSEEIVGFNLDQNNTITPLNTTTNLKAAVRLSPILHQQIVNYTTENQTYTPKIVLTIYQGSQLFVETDGSHKSSNLVIGVSLPGFQQPFQGPVMIYYFETTGQYQNCSFWKFRDGTTGTWSLNGTEEFEEAVVCQYYHLTNFALIDSWYCPSGSSNGTVAKIDNLHYSAKGVAPNWKRAALNCHVTPNLTVAEVFVGLPTLHPAYATLDNLADLIEEVFQSSKVHQGLLETFDDLLESFTDTQLVVRDHVVLITASKQDSVHFKGIRVSEGEVSCLTEETVNPGEVTVLFTHRLRQQIKTKKSRILIAIFSDNYAFPGGETIRKPVVEVLMPELQQTSLEGDIIIHYNHSQGGCSYWNGYSWIVESSAIQGRCRFNHVTHFALLVDSKNITSDLEQILESNLTSLEKLQQVNTILTVNHHSLVAFDIFLISRILTTCLSDGFPMVSRIVSALFQVPQAILSESQQKHSATDLILFAVDRMSRLVTRMEEHHSNFSVIVRNIENLTGMILYDCQEYSCSFEFLEGSIKITDYSVNVSVTAMVVFNQSLLEQIRRTTPNPRIAISVYYTNVLFNEIHTQRATTKIFGVIFPNFNETTLEGNVTVVNKITTTKSNQCAYWMYNPTGINTTFGKWINESKNQRDHSLAICSYSHVTHFGMLLSNSDYLDDDPVLDFVTDIGCVLSLFGILVVLVTAMFFKRWRQNTGNQILIHFSIAISLTIITLYTSVYVKKISYGVWCTVTGAILHYAILSECGWMLTVAILQFKRFVEVLGGPPKYVLIKALICGWVFPLIPVLCVVLLDPHNYEKGLANLCYPSNLGLYLGVWLPVLLVLTTNLIIFIIIMYNIFHKKTEYIDTTNQEILFQWRLALLLFFMLGLNMIFGFFAQIKDEKVFVYLYSITASMQGFVLFLFFILFNKSTRSLYSQSVKQWFYAKGIFQVKQGKKDNT